MAHRHIGPTPNRAWRHPGCTGTVYWLCRWTTHHGAYCVCVLVCLCVRVCVCVCVCASNAHLPSVPLGHTGLSQAVWSVVCACVCVSTLTPLLSGQVIQVSHKLDMIDCVRYAVSGRERTIAYTHIKTHTHTRGREASWLTHWRRAGMGRRRGERVSVHECV